MLPPSLLAGGLGDEKWSSTKGMARVFFGHHPQLLTKPRRVVEGAKEAPFAPKRGPKKEKGKAQEQKKGHEVAKEWGELGFS